MSDRHFVKKQKLKEIAGSSGAYEQWVEGHKGSRSKGYKYKGGLDERFGRVSEDVLANPDSLREDEGMYADSAPSTPRYLMGEAIEYLQGRQKEVYFLTMREGRSLTEVAEILAIEKGTAQKYKERAIKFIETYCKQMIAKGRV
jgi:DNA-directed RNA polymerase specialized sigma24 family protein